MWIFAVPSAGGQLALPLLAIAGLHVRTIFKYTFPVCVVSGLVFTITTLWWGHMI